MARRTMPECTYTDQDPLLAEEKQFPELQVYPSGIIEKSKRYPTTRVYIMLIAMLALCIVRVSLAIGVFDRSSKPTSSIEERVNKILTHTPLIGAYFVHLSIVI